MNLDILPKLVPVVLKLKDTYSVWQKYLDNFPKNKKFTLGSKIDVVFLETIELSFIASYSNLETKVPLINKIIIKIDLLKLLTQIAWEQRAIDNNKFIELSNRLLEIGKMLGGWKKQLQTKTLPSEKGREMK
jgi:hypothetical protein